MLLLSSSEDLNLKKFLVPLVLLLELCSGNFSLVLSLTTDETDENNNNDNLRMQSTIGKETLAAPMYKENRNQLFPQVHFENNLLPISSSLSELLRNGPNVVVALSIVPLNFFC